MSSLSAPRWRRVPRDAIVWREWDGEFVVRNERSGSTHLLGPLAGTVLQILLDADDTLSVADIAARVGELQVADIAARVGELQAVAAKPDWCTAIDEVLAEFHRLDLAEPVRP